MSDLLGRRRCAPPEVRFVRFVIPEPNSGCWLWLGSVTPFGHGRFQLTKRSVLAHRFSWEMYRSPIPPGMVLDHTCRNPSCVNPDHLRVVTPRINAIENSLGPTALCAAKKHCPKCGGDYRLEKLGRGKVGRRCRRCHVEANRLRLQARKREAGVVTRDEWLAGKRSKITEKQVRSSSRWSAYIGRDTLKEETE